MKVPVLKVHIVTDKTLEQKLEAAKTEGRTFAEKQIESLLHRNAKMSLALRNLAGGKKRFGGESKREPKGR